MEWPEIVRYDEVQSRLINDGMPVERVMRVVSELRTTPHGGRYRVERAVDALLFYAMGNGYYRVASE